MNQRMNRSQALANPKLNLKENKHSYALRIRRQHTVARTVHRIKNKRLKLTSKIDLTYKFQWRLRCVCVCVSVATNQFKRTFINSPLARHTQRIDYGSVYWAWFYTFCFIFYYSAIIWLYTIHYSIFVCAYELQFLEFWQRAKINEQTIKLKSRVGGGAPDERWSNRKQKEKTIKTINWMLNE